MKRYVFLLFIVVTLEGVVSCTPYVAPEGVELASLRLVSTSAGNTLVYKDYEWEHISCDFENYQAMAVLGAPANAIVNQGGGRDLGIPLKRTDVPVVQQSELKIESGTPLSFSFHNVHIYKIHILPPHYSYIHCMQKIVFTPSANGIYEAVYEVPDSETPDSCKALLYEIVPLGDSYKRVEHSDYVTKSGTCRRRQ